MMATTIRTRMAHRRAPGFSAFFGSGRVIEDVSFNVLIGWCLASQPELLAIFLELLQCPFGCLSIHQKYQYAALYHYGYSQWFAAEIPHAHTTLCPLEQ